MLLAAYLPEWINTEPKSTAKTATSASENAKVTFEFPDLLKDSEIQVDTSAYEKQAAGSRRQTHQFSRSAASFRDEDDANEFRAKLILLNLSATVVTGTGSTGEWHRHRRTI